MKRILIATGIFPPDIGGPALYSQKLAEQFSKNGSDVPVFTYGKNFSNPDNYRIFSVSRLWPYGLRQLIYFLKLAWHVRKSDAILTFDSLGAGLPAVIAGKLSGVKVVIRLGGDFLWEKYIESGKEKVTIAEFYEKNLQRNFPFLLRLIKFTLRSADRIAFTTEFQRDFFISAYGLDSARAIVITNVFSAGGEKKSGEVLSYQSTPKIILWAGRFIKLKNLEFLLKVFKRLADHDGKLVLKLIGDGPDLEKLKAESRKLSFGEGSTFGGKVENKVLFVNRLNEEALADEIRKSYFCVLPSLSEVSPNFALKCLSLNKPIIITQETGIRTEFPGLMYADPKNEESFYLAMLRLLDENSYDNYRKVISGIRYEKSWQDLAEEYLKLLQ